LKKLDKGLSRGDLIHWTGSHNVFIVVYVDLKRIYFYDCEQREMDHLNPFDVDAINRTMARGNIIKH
jgi:hypothetical protein